jgi:type I restriction enzyme R subunit
VSAPRRRRRVWHQRHDLAPDHSHRTIHGCDYAAALEAEPAKVLRVYLGAIDYVLDVKNNVGEETGWQRFRGMVKRLATAFALAVPGEETREVAPRLAFFQRVAAMIRKRLADEAGRTPGAGGPVSGWRDIDAAVRQVIGGAVDASDVIDLFAAAGLGAARLDIWACTSLVRSPILIWSLSSFRSVSSARFFCSRADTRSRNSSLRMFREALEKAMLGYTNKQISTAQMIVKLLELAEMGSRVEAARGGARPQQRGDGVL